jgi:hypothetical protein
MGKRSSFDRIERDFYPTPLSAVVPLLPHLKPGTRFAEPCAGDGALIDILTDAGHHCAAAWDIEPQRADIERHDATQRLVGNVDCFVTNPPWDRKILHRLIPHLSIQHPAWLLFDADWIHTRQAVPFLPMLRKVVSVGRVKWIPGSPFAGKDNCCWHLFDANAIGDAILIGRAA